MRYGIGLNLFEPSFLPQVLFFTFPYPHPYPFAVPQIVSEFDQIIPQSHTADQPMAL